jgi:dihydrofolate reductase
MKAVIAVNNLGFIGLNNGLPWPPNKEDFKHFKSLTMGSTLIVGHNTHQILPPLKGREIILVDRDIPLLHYLQYDWCIGGKKTYESFCPYFTELHISHINDNSIGDTTFPDFSKLNPNCQIFNYYF